MTEQITTKPFASQAQWRFAWATGQPWARRWAHETPGGKGTRYRRLPRKVRKKAANYGARVGQTITGRLVRGEGGKFSSTGAAPAKPPPKTPRRTGGGKRAARAARRAQERQARQAQRQQEREAARQQSDQAKRAERDRILNAAGLDNQTRDALVDARAGDQLAPVNGAKLAAMGLAEQGADGSYRLTAAGREVVNAANAGDAGRARDTMGSARDQQQARQQRQSAAAQRRAQAAQRRAQGGGGKQPKKRQPVKRAAPRAPSSTPIRTVGGTGGGGAAPKPAQPKPAKPEPKPKPQIAPALQQAAQAVIDGAATEGQIAQLVRAGLARRDRQGNVSLTAAGLRATQKASSPGDYLVVEDRAHPTTWHLQVKRNGTPDHRLMGAAWAALHGGYRGNTYQGPNKQEAIRKLRALYEREGMDVPTEKASSEPDILQLETWRVNSKWEGLPFSDPFDYRTFVTKQVVSYSKPSGGIVVVKDASGAHRWVAFSSNAYRDRDNEIVSTKALEADCARADKDGNYGPLRWWHVGGPAGKGWDLGACDFNAMHGRVLVESGTFKSAAIGAAVAKAAPNLQLSIGFIHGPDQPDDQGVFHDIRRFERSLVPTGRAANPFTRLLVKELTMDQEKETSLKTLLGDEVAQQVLDGAETVQKDADSKGVAFKSDDPWYSVAMAIKAAMQPAPAPEPDAVAEKADGEVAEPEAKADPMMAEAEAEPMMEEEVDDPEQPTLSIGDFKALDALITSKLAPLAGLLDMEKKMTGHVQTLLGQYQQTKDASEAEAVAAKDAEIAALKARIDALEGDVPNAYQAIVNGGYRASTDPKTVATKAEAAKLGAPAADDANPFADIMQNLFGAQSPNGH